MSLDLALLELMEVLAIVGAPNDKFHNRKLFIFSTQIPPISVQLTRMGRLSGST